MYDDFKVKNSWVSMVYTKIIERCISVKIISRLGYLSDIGTRVVDQRNKVGRICEIAKLLKGRILCKYVSVI